MESILPTFSSVEESLEDVAAGDNWSEEIDEVFDVVDSVNELLGELDSIASGVTTHESEHYNGYIKEFVENMDEEDLYDLGQKDGEIRLARKLLKTWRGGDV